jgi:cleavage and polyadenylation specificity factor subunit 3
MTHATKAVMRLLVSDFIKLLGSSKGGALYSESELISCIEKIEVVDYHHTIEHKGIKFCGYAAGHVLGAAMFTINIDGVVVLYTGDYSMEEDRSVPFQYPLYILPHFFLILSLYLSGIFFQPKSLTNILTC